MKKGWVYIGAFVAGILVLAEHHMGDSLGAGLFRAVGVSPWTGDNDTGLRLPVVLGAILVIIGLVGATKALRQRVPNILGILAISAILFIVSFPFVSEKAMFLAHYNSDSIDSIDITDGQCSYSAEDRSAQAICSFTLYNYGKRESVVIRPLTISDQGKEIVFKEHEVTLKPQQKDTMSIRFNGEANINEYTYGVWYDADFEIR